MKSVKLAWILGAVSALALGMAAEACSSSSTTSPDAGGGGSGTGTGHPGSGTSSTSGTGTSSGTGATGSSTGTGSGSCFSIATEVFAEDAGGGHMYCPFSAVTDGGKSIYCTAGEQCCVPPEGMGASLCIPIADTCANPSKAVDWQCEGTPDCNGRAGTICCGQGKLEAQSAQPGCGSGGSTTPASEYVSGFYGSACQASCTNFGSGTGAAFQICSQNSECTAAGTICLPIKVKGNDIGYCGAGVAGSGSGSTSGTGSASGSGSSSGTADSGAHDAAGDH